MQKLINWYNTAPIALKKEDICAVTITAHIVAIDHEKNLLFVRCYRCPYPGGKNKIYWPLDPNGDPIPQGQPVGAEQSIAIFKAIWPNFAECWEIRYL